MARWYEAVNQASFKSAPGGYVFQSPNVWMFGRPRYYLVTEAQKAAILPHMGHWRLRLLLVVLAEALLLGSLIAFVNLAPATFLRLVAPAFQFGVGAFAVGMFALMILVLIPPMLVPQVYLNRSLAPVLAAASPTDQRIALGDQLPKIAGSISVWVMALGLFGGVCIIGAALAGLVEAYLEGHWKSALFWPFLPPFAVGALVTSYFVYLWILRARLRRSAVVKIEVD